MSNFSSRIPWTGLYRKIHAMVLMFVSFSTSRENFPLDVKYSTFAEIKIKKQKEFLSMYRFVPLSYGLVSFITKSLPTLAQRDPMQGRFPAQIRDGLA